MTPGIFAFLWLLTGIVAVIIAVSVDVRTRDHDVTLTTLLDAIPLVLLGPITLFLLTVYFIEQALDKKQRGRQ